MEDLRQIVHFALGFVILLLWLESPKAAYITCIGGMCGIVIYNHIKHLVNMGFVKRIESIISREHEVYFGEALITYIGSVILLLAAFPYSAALFGIICLSVGDAFSNIIGRNGTHRIIWNKNKTWEGYAGFVASSFIVSLILLGIDYAILSVIVGILETLKTKIDDNIIVSISAGLLGVILIFLKQGTL